MKILKKILDNPKILEKNIMELKQIVQILFSKIPPIPQVPKPIEYMDNYELIKNGLYSHWKLYEIQKQKDKYIESITPP